MPQNDNGRSTAISLSALQVAGGIFATATGNPVLGAMLLGSGLSGGQHAYNNEDEQFDGKEYIKKSTVGATVGFVTGGISTLGNGVRISMCAGAAGRVTNDCAQAAADGEEMPPADMVLKSAAIGAATGGFASRLANFSNDTTSSAMKGLIVGADDVAIAVAEVGSGAVTGGVVSAAGTAVDNLSEGKPITEGVAESAAVGAAIGGAIAGVKAHAENTTERKILEPKAAENSMAPKNGDIDKMAKKGYKFKVGGKYVSAEQAKNALNNGKTVKYKYKKALLNPKRVRGTMTRSPQPQQPPQPSAPIAQPNPLQQRVFNATFFPQNHRNLGVEEEHHARDAAPEERNAEENIAEDLLVVEQLEVVQDEENAIEGLLLEPPNEEVDDVASEEEQDEESSDEDLLIEAAAAPEEEQDEESSDEDLLIEAAAAPEEEHNENNVVEHANNFIATFNALKEKVENMSQLSQRVQHAVFVNQLPRDMRNIKMTLSEIELGCDNVRDKVKQIVKDSSRLGSGHPILKAANRCLQTLPKKIKQANYCAANYM